MPTLDDAAAFEPSYHGLGDVPTRLYRLLIVDCGPDVSAAAAGVLAGLPVSEVRTALEALAVARLVESSPGSEDRWRIHKPLRPQAQRLSNEHALADGREQARDRLLGYYLTMADAADRYLKAVPDTQLPAEFSDRDAALAWLDAEREGLMAAVAMAAQTGRDLAVLHFLQNLGRYLVMLRHFDDWITVLGIGLEAARRLGDRLSEAAVQGNLGIALRQSGRPREAIAALQESASVYRETSDRNGEGQALTNLGLALGEAERWEEAVGASRDAVAAFRETGGKYGEGRALNDLGLALRNTRRFADAMSAHKAAIAICRETGDRYGEAAALNNLGRALQQVQRFSEASTAYRSAAAIFREIGDPHTEDIVLRNLRETGTKLFLSYSSRERDFVRRLAGDLQQVGLDVWLDERELRVGEDLAAIEAAVRGSDCLAVVLSRAAAESRWVEREIELAESLGVQLLPILLEDVPGPWNERFSRLAHADFRRQQEYRRSVHRLIAAIEGVSGQGRFLSAKEAVAAVRSRRNPVGDLFGLSQQGVATLYSFARCRDWQFADVTDGASRLWITEFYDPRTKIIQAYAVMDGEIHDLPELRLYGSDGAPAKNSTIVYSHVMNDLIIGPVELSTLPGPGADSTSADDLSAGDPGKRYSRFLPVPLMWEFVDSTAAVAAAIESAEPVARSGNLFALAKLECDKRHWDLPTWTVAFFDPALADSVVAIGVDAATGTVRHPRMRTEILNGDFFSVSIDEKTGAYSLSMASQLRAINNHVWDIPEAGDAMPPDLTAGEALAMAQELLQSTGDAARWQLGFLSNTGVVRTELSPALPSPHSRLMRRSGRAGQWVVEVFGLDATPVSEGDRKGFSYSYKRILCTRAEGAADTGARPTLVLTSPLVSSPLSSALLDAYERARMLAIQVAGANFTVMSVALARKPPEAEWHFRFYGPEDIIASVTVSGDGSRVTASRTY